MIIFSKKATVTLDVNVRSESRGPERLIIEMTNNEIIFRARSLRTEADPEFSRKNPSLMTNAVRALIPDIYPSEMDALSSELISTLKGITK